MTHREQSRRDSWFILAACIIAGTLGLGWCILRGAAGFNNDGSGPPAVACPVEEIDL